MVYKQKHIDQPMSLLDLTLRLGDRYVYNYFDMDGYNSTVFSNFYGSKCKNIFSVDHWLDSLHHSKNDNWYIAICQSMFSTCSRCISPFLSKFSLGHKQTLADTDSYAGQNLLFQRNHH